MAPTTRSQTRRVAMRPRKAEDNRKASEEIFDTVEMLEQILSSLPLRELLLHGPLVSRGFKFTIDGSPILQEKLFFRLPEETPLKGIAIELNPLLAGSQGLLRRCAWYRHSYLLVTSLKPSSGARVFTLFDLEVYDEVEDDVVSLKKVKPSLKGSDKPGRAPRGSWRRIFLSRSEHAIWVFAEDANGEEYSSRPVVEIWGGVFEPEEE